MRRISPFARVLLVVAAGLGVGGAAYALGADRATGEAAVEVEAAAIRDSEASPETIPFTTCGEGCIH